MMLDFEQVREILPQRYPFIMIDGVLELEPGKRIVAFKNVSGNEPIFVGHFPNKAILPGAYIVEAMAQAGIILWDEGKRSDKTFLFSAAKIRFLAPVVPGNQLIIEIKVERQIATGAIVFALAKVGDKVVARGQLTFAVL
jgi:3-hydroxyacyl-[acyl-carrier-protein] dehydratase